MSSTIDLANGRSSLSAKETRALELVAAQFNTKEIARQLGISPRAVEERLKSAREKLDAPDRRAAARILLEQGGACGITTGGPTTVDEHHGSLSQGLRELPETSVFTLEDSALQSFSGDDSAPTFLEAFDVRFGKPGRLAAIVLLAVTLGLLGAAAVSIAVTLGQLVN